MTSTQEIQWKCVESRMENKRLHYGRFVVSPFERGQASTVGIAMRRALLEEVVGAGITSAKFEEVVHEYSTMTGIQETIHDVLVNLKVIGIRSESNEAKNAFLSVRGPKRVTAGDIVIPPSVKILDDSQYILTIIQPISLNIELKIENSCRYRTEGFKVYQTGEFPVGAIPMPVRNVNYSVHPFENGVEMREILFMEIWTNGSLTPEEALFKASKKLIFLLNPFLHIRGSNIPNLGTNQNSSDLSKSFLQFDDVGKSKEILTNTFIDQLELPARAFNCLKRAEIHTINDLLKYSRDDLLKLKSSGKKSVDQVSKALWERFATELPGSEVRMD